MSGSALWRRLILAGLGIGAAGPATAAVLPPITCTFQSQHLTLSAPGTWLGFEKGNSIELTFTDIDVEKQTARVAQSPASGAIRVVKGDGSLSFLEVTALGGVIATTVLTGTLDFPDRTMNAAHSRHVITSDHEMIVAQYIGFCTRG